MKFKTWLKTWYHSFVCNDNVQRSRSDVGERKRGSAWRQGRWYLRYGREPVRKSPEHPPEYDHPHVFKLEWSWFRRNMAALGIGFDVSEGSEVTLRFGIPWICSLWIGHTVSERFMRWLLPWYVYAEGRSGGWPLSREIDVSVHHAKVWCHLWVDPMNGDYGDYGETQLPRWRTLSFSINPLDLLGRVRCRTELLGEPRDALIPLPEGEYLGTLQLERRVWTRRLWPWWPLKHVRVSRDVEVPDGIPFSGKGESEWDCGEDGLFATGFDVETASTDEQACALYAACVLETRVRRGDPRTWPESPRDRASRIATLRAKRQDTACQEDPL
jgi:hypothetical protein